MIAKEIAEFQSEIVASLNVAVRRVGGKLIISNLTKSARPVMWVCADASHRRAICAEMRRKGYHLYGLFGRMRYRLGLTFGPSISAIAYRQTSGKGFQTHGPSSGVEINFCSYDPARKKWVSSEAGVENEASEDYLNDLEDFEYCGVRLPILRSARILYDQHPGRKKIDVVYTWVDGTDPKWLERRRAFEPQGSIQDAADAARFVSHQELLFSVRSVLRYFVDLGQIYIVTDDQIPEFLGEYFDRVSIISHRDLISDPSVLPTFNSHVIEANLHRIQGLSENFLYFNDDVILGSAVSGVDFFDEFGRSYQFPSSLVSIPHAPLGKTDLGINAAARNNRKLLHERFGYFIYRKFKHVPIAINKSLMRQMETELPEAWAATMPNRFRSPDDYSIGGNLYTNYAAIKGRSVIGSIRYGYFNTSSKTAIRNAGLLLLNDWYRPQAFCLNDTVMTDDSIKAKQVIFDILNHVLPPHPGVPEPRGFAQPLWKIRNLFYRNALRLRWLWAWLGP